MITEDAEVMFTDPALRTAAVETGPVFAAAHARLNAVSRDIKNLEQHLANTPVRTEVRIPISDADEALLWMRGEPDAWRVIFSGAERKPLIECTVDVRLRAYPFLPALLRAVAAVAEAANSGNPAAPRSDT